MSRNVGFHTSCIECVCVCVCYGRHSWIYITKQRRCTNVAKFLSVDGTKGPHCMLLIIEQNKAVLVQCSILL